MKYVRKWVRCFIVFNAIGFSAKSFAAPAMEMLAINSKTKECMRYFPGDEFAQSKLVGTDWKKHPAYGDVKTDFGTCKFSAKPTDFENCCKQLKLKFLSAEASQKNLKHSTTGP